MKIMAVLMVGALLLGGPVGAAWAQKERTEAAGTREASGLDPFLQSSTTCDHACPETFEVKCTQASRYLVVEVGDDWRNRSLSQRWADSFTHGLLIGLAPAGLNWKARGPFGISGPGDGFTLSLTRPGSEGTMRAMVVVQSTIGANNDRWYAVDAYCWSDVTGSYRNTSITRMSDY